MPVCFLHALVDGLSAEVELTPNADIVITSYLQQRLTDDISVNQLAKLANLSLSRFHSCFARGGELAGAISPACAFSMRATAR